VLHRTVHDLLVRAPRRFCFGEMLALRAWKCKGDCGYLTKSFPKTGGYIFESGYIRKQAFVMAIFMAMP
jgi:hypothetical protein